MDTVLTRRTIGGSRPLTVPEWKRLLAGYVADHGYEVRSQSSLRRLAEKAVKRTAEAGGYVDQDQLMQDLLVGRRPAVADLRGDPYRGLKDHDGLVPQIPDPTPVVALWGIREEAPR